MSTHDRYLAGFDSWTETVYCPNQDCENYQGIEIKVESEYGQSWAVPEECPLCFSYWQFSRPKDE